MEKICSVCGCMFTAQRSTARYCGTRCRKRAQRSCRPVTVAPDGKPTIDNIADIEPAIISARMVSNEFAKLSVSGLRQYRAGCRRISIAIHDAIEMEGW